MQSSPPLAAPDAIDPALVTPRPANGNTRLKGTIWPGMALFDAATPLEARRRNQKKDASVVKRMERLSHMVVPNEVTFSIEWSFKKSRHIDDLDDATSLVEGESPLMLKPKPKPRGRKKALTNISSNAPRISKRKAKASPSPKRGRRAPKSGTTPAIARIPSSAHPTGFSDPFTPMNQGEDLKFSIGNLRPKKAHAEVNIYEDSPDDESKPPQLLSLSDAYSMLAPRLTFHSAPWLQPQNQNPLFFDGYDNPYRSGTLTTTSRDFASNKENINPVVDHGEAVNPLVWPTPQRSQVEVASAPASSFGPFAGLVAAGGLPDPFGVAKNPLADPFAHLEDEKSTSSIKPLWSTSARASNPLQPLITTTNHTSLRMR
jgi:hypothetical protein